MKYWWGIGNLIKKAGEPIPHRETPAGMKHYLNTIIDSNIIKFVQ
jgi:hypothetical protein